MGQACAPGSDRHPDYIVLPYMQPQQAAGSWTILDPVTRDVMKTFRLYRCSDVMEQLPSTKEPTR